MAATTTAPLSTSQLKYIAAEFFTALCNKPRDIDRAGSYLAPDAVMQHDDWPAFHGKEKYLAFFKNLVENMAPEFHAEVKRMVAEVSEDGNGGGEVWAYSRISGSMNGVSRDSVDMVKINAEGKIYSIRDVQRTITPEGGS